mmetsp:Transcript_33789/g.105378  ORF Transcript_33789/g.105378 Transcript_33789/m.105378 type:complete len:373 (+) Transcript_33789:46-1164(+)
MAGRVAVRVTALSGAPVVSLDLATWEPVAAVKRQAAKAAGAPASEVRLTLGEQVLADSTRLKDLQAVDDSELALCMVRSRQGLNAFFGGEDGALRSWKPRAPPARGHAAAMRCLDVDWASSSALSGGADGTLHLWDTRRLRSLTAYGLRGHSREVRCLAADWASDRAVSGGADGLLIFWDLKRGTITRKVNAANATICCVCVDGTSQLVVSSGSDGLLEAHNWSTYQSVWQAADRPHAARCMALDSVSGQALTGGEDSNLKVWHPGRADAALRTLHGRCGPVRCLSADWAEQRALSGGDDGSLWLWSLEDGEAVRCICSHSAPVKCLAVEWSSQQAASGYTDGVVRLWSLTSGEALEEAPHTGAGASCVALG